MNKAIKIFFSSIVLVVVACAGLAVFVGTLDADKYRPQLVEAISQKTGRAVKLNGPIGFSLGLGEIRVSVQDASISNPEWASRPVLAKMGRFELGVEALPLLARRLSVKTLSIENADILLETNAAGARNWDFSPSAAPAAKAAGTENSSAAPSGGASLSIGKLSILNSQLALRGGEGKISSYNVSSLELGMRGLGAELKFNGDVNGAPIRLDVKTSMTDLLSQAPFSFDADASYGGFHFTGQGKADLAGKRLTIPGYALTAGPSKITGDLEVAWGGARPAVHGTIASDHLNPADFKADAAAPGGAGDASQDVNSGKRLFSDAPLPLAALKAVDAELGVTVG